MKTAAKNSGDHAENLALSFFQAKSFQLEERNFLCRHGEIDLIMWDQDYLVFIEVRYRASEHFGGATGSIDSRKQNKLRKTAEYYLINTKRTDCPCRFDILCLGGNFTNPNYNWIRNAF